MDASRLPAWTAKTKSAFRELLGQISKLPGAEAFHYPVSKSLYPSYYEQIEQPMDIQTLKKSISQFESLAEALTCLRLMWRNCLQFNEASSEIAHAAVTTGNESEKLIEEYFGDSAIDHSWNINTGNRKRRSRSESSTKELPKHLLLAEETVATELSSTAIKDIFKNIMNSEFAAPFIEPVREEDAPGYRDVVDCPMDLQTIKKKLRRGDYDGNSSEFENDFKLLYENCLLYNEAGSDITKLAQSLYNEFEILVAEHRPSIAQTPIASKKRSRIEETDPLAKSAETPTHSMPSTKKKHRANKVTETTSLEVIDLPSLLSDIKRYSDVEPFLYPVDLKRVAGYSEVIEVPMDISTVEKNLKKGLYGTDISLFVEHVRLIWTNCISFNKPDSDIAIAAQHCSDLFEESLRMKIAEKLTVKQELTSKLTSNGASSCFSNKKKLVDSDEPKIEIIPPTKVIKQDKQENSAGSSNQDELVTFSIALQRTIDREVELVGAIESLKSGNCAQPAVRDHCHKQAFDKYKDLKNGYVLAPMIMEVEKFGDIGHGSPCGADYIFPSHFTSSRTVRIGISPHQEDNTNPLFVMASFKSSIVSENSGLRFQISLRKGVNVCSSDDPQKAWQEIFGKEALILRSLGSKLRRCRCVLNRLSASPDSVPFMDPIGGDAEAVNYYKVISAPMWLREIHRRFVVGVYDNEYDFAWDMRLIFRNCQQYNLPKSSLFAASQRLSNLFEALFLHWVVNIEDRSVDEPAVGDWSDWSYLRCFDSDPDNHYCVISKKKAKKNELLRCGWCEDEFLPASLGMPASKANLKTWGCSRCRKAMDAAEGDVANPPYNTLQNDLPFSASEVGGEVYVLAPQHGVGWLQARRKNRLGLKNMFLSPLGYELYSIDNIASQIEFESQVDKDLLLSRAKEFKEETGEEKKSSGRRKSSKRRRSALKAVDSEATTTKDEIDVEGTIPLGRLAIIDLESCDLNYFVNSDECQLIQRYKDGEDISTMLKWDLKLLRENIGRFGCFGFEHMDVRQRIEALPNAQSMESYCFANSKQAIQDLLKKFEEELAATRVSISKAQVFRNSLLHTRWKHELDRIMPKPARATAISEQQQSEDDQFSASYPSWGFKMVVSKAFPAGGMDTLLALWDYLESAEPIIGHTYFTLLDLICSLNAPQAGLMNPSQMVFDELGCIMTEQLLMECRRTIGLISETDWQKLLMVYPLNVVTWPKVLEMCLVILNLPLSHQQVHSIMMNSLDGCNATCLKLLVIVFNHPLVQYLCSVREIDVSKRLDDILESSIASLVGKRQVDLEVFCGSLTDTFHSCILLEDNLIQQRAHSIVSYLLETYVLFGIAAAGASCDDLGNISDDLLLSCDVQFGGASMRKFKHSAQTTTQHVLPHHFDCFSTNFQFKIRALTHLRRTLLVTAGLDTELYVAQDRMMVYSCLVDQCTACNRYLVQCTERETQFHAKFENLPLTMPMPGLSLASAGPNTKSFVCALTGISSTIVPESAAWVILPDRFAVDQTDVSVAPIVDTSFTRQQSLRRRVETTEINNQVALKSAVLQQLQCEAAASVDIRLYEDENKVLMGQLSAIDSTIMTTIDCNISKRFSRCHPMGFDRHDNAVWLLNVQQKMCIFEHDARGKSLAPLGQSTREPCLLLRDVHGQWYYSSETDISRYLNSLSSDIEAESMLRMRIVEKYVLLRWNLLSGTLNIKSGQQPWIDRKHALEAWIAESAQIAMANDDSKCKHLELVWARCAESRMSTYYLNSFNDEDDPERSQRAEREASYRKSKKLREQMADDSFDLHAVKGWLHIDPATRLRQLAATTTATRLLADPTLCVPYMSILARSSFCVKDVDVEADQENEAAIVGVSNEVGSSVLPCSDTNDVADKEVELEIATATPTCEENHLEETEDTKEKSKKPHSSRIVEQLHLITGEVLRIYPNGREAANFLNIAQSGISLCTTGQKNDSFGFRWRLYEGPPVDFGEIESFQATAEELKSYQVLKSSVPNEDSVRSTVGRTARLYDAIRSKFENSDHCSGPVPQFKPIVPQLQSSATPASSTVVVPIVRPASTLTGAELQNFTFATPPAIQNNKLNIVTSTRVLSAKFLKLKSELFNILYCFPEKAIRWPELPAVSESHVVTAGEVAARHIRQAQRGTGMSEAEIDRLADKSSRKARRRLRRKLALDHFSERVQSASSPQELMNQVIVLENSIPSAVLYTHCVTAKPSVAITLADVALRLYTLDRQICFSDIVDLENATAFCSFKLRTHFSPRCAASALCNRTLGHSGKCSLSTFHTSRLPDLPQLLDQARSLSVPNSAQVQLPQSRPPTSTQTARPLPAPRQHYEEPFPSFASLAQKANIDIEFMTPYFPINISELVDSHWL